MKPFAAVVLFAACAAPSAFATTTIDFEAVTSYASIADFYNGGTDSAGKAGPALGISFGGDAIAVDNDLQVAQFSNAPSPVGVMAPVGSDSALNAAAGFAGSIGFYYSSSAAIVGGLQVWSGLDGTGTLLASFDLAANADSGCNDSPYCHFDALDAAFSGVAHSVTFGNAVGVAAFDNLTVAVVPEPSTYATMAAGLVGLAVVARRRRG